MTFLYIVVGLVLIFDFINGFHDSANSIATIVSTKVLSPLAAVSMAAFFNFIAFVVFPLRVATTIGKGVVNPDVISLTVIAAALLAAITWNLFTWWYGLPSSSSHTLVGGLVGAAVASSGWGSVVMAGVIKIVVFIVIAPLIGMIMSFIISAIVIYIARNHSPLGVDKYFRRLQLLSAAAFSLGHGGNDAQKSMGIIWVALIAAGLATKNDPIALWIVLSCHTAIALGTLTGGWRIVKTMGQKITKLKPFEGFCAETAGAITLFGATHFGIPVSTTHTITGAIIGVGARKGISAVKWGVTRNIFWAWILTIPVSAVVGSLIFHFLKWILA
ncbi:MAG: inorganic phosphate transporter [Bacteroidetes bacterium GWE2_41_25]|nr:MAG: inorganic phosphate transporter [Bacteroidetes bacterium GWA2_40_15]OFX92917.1 MAG: inorganic phosphate transporter [Bacteroidetes bacterium GWC2_40_22]OFY09377.1 MAG: inorganic phosphate transporter [Bacteroidetes bacterium GWE2_41_25]OFY59616.1 MAG: inorganic phosphate transporter [Bacteroidetes bacterium GWF2_41_9]HBH84525.1 anion permease [Bacteroidales bacterium]